jgi:hypothetical protein
MAAQRVLDRRPVWTARQWDGSEEFLDWVRPGLDQGFLTYDDQDGTLRLWGAVVPDGGWLVFRDGWYDLQPTTEAYEAKYEPAPADEAPPEAPPE